VTLLLTNHNDSADDWKVVVPRGVTEQQIHDSLLKHLQTLDSQKASWPADETDAYKAVTREVLGAFSESCSTHRMHHGMNGNDMNNAGNTNANGQNGGTGDTGNSANH
jgi:predicted metal-dependent hydrolase